MIVLKLRQDSQNSIDVIARALSLGKIIVCPTDTLYGLTVLANKKKAIKNIDKMKRRPAGKSYIILVKDLAMAKKYARISRAQEQWLKNIWPGPVTVLLESRHKLSGLESADGAIAIRWPKNRFVNQIITTTEAPIVSTSVNLSGSKPLNSPQAIIKFFKNRQYAPDLVIDAGMPKRKKPSKLIDLRDIDNIKIIRN
jgi:L-threonylcarbamoyladenylate synthase